MCPRLFRTFVMAKVLSGNLRLLTILHRMEIAERMNRTIQEKVRSMLSNAELPNGFWAEAVATAVHLINKYLPVRFWTKKQWGAEMVWTGKPTFVQASQSLWL